MVIYVYVLISIVLGCFVSITQIHPVCMHVVLDHIATTFIDHVVCLSFQDKGDELLEQTRSSILRVIEAAKLNNDQSSDNEQTDIADTEMVRL